MYCFLEFKLRYLKNLKLFSISVKENNLEKKPCRLITASFHVSWQNGVQGRVPFIMSLRETHVHSTNSNQVLQSCKYLCKVQPSFYSKSTHHTKVYQWFIILYTNSTTYPDCILYVNSTMMSKYFKNLHTKLR